jgi:hypothetical protein
MLCRKERKWGFFAFIENQREEIHEAKEEKSTQGRTSREDWQRQEIS